MVADNGELAGKADEDPKFDRILIRLREVVERLEGGKLSLEESLLAYEEGVGLARRGHAVLDQAEKRVELLVRAGEGGITTRPLDVDGESAASPESASGEDP